MNKHDKEFWENKRRLYDNKEQKNKNYKKSSNDRLCNIIGKNFQTVTIGALAIFEENFGWIWGHDLKEEELDENQRRAAAVWEETRNRILDRGNDKRRSSIKEIQNHDVKWNRYNYKFKVKN